MLALATAEEEEEQSAVSSIVGSDVGSLTDDSRHLFGAARFDTLKVTLTPAAANKTVVN
jgi:hypothetical protein